MKPRMKPTKRPVRTRFSSGPCAKRPGWTPEVLADAAVGRSHRSALGRLKLREVIELSRELLEIPSDYRVGIVPASDTGAVEMLLWSMLGARGVDMLAWESFGSEWVTDVIDHLQLDAARTLLADYGELPDLTNVDFTADIVFTWNGTTSGVRVPNGDWIPDEREGLTICDATSAVFAMELPWPKLDCVTWSWQKALGGEGGHGMLALSPRAVERLESYTPARPLPKIFRLTLGGKLIEGIFLGETINTPSLLCVEDAIDSLSWVKSIGGLTGTIRRAEENLTCVANWVAASDWVDFLARSPETRSCTSICLRIVDPAFTNLSAEDQTATAKRVVSLLADEGVALDVGSYRDAPPGFRVWGGATVENDDVAALLPWFDWAYAEVSDSDQGSAR
ncbi:MAG: phosphoserine transaminase [Myxococcota bacterium]